MILFLDQSAPILSVFHGPAAKNLCSGDPISWFLRRWLATPTWGGMVMWPYHSDLGSDWNSVQVQAHFLYEPGDCLPKPSIQGMEKGRPIKMKRLAAHRLLFNNSPTLFVFNYNGSPTHGNLTIVTFCSLGQWQPIWSISWSFWYVFLAGCGC